MGYDELREYLRPIVERRPIAAKNPYLLSKIWMDWERRKHLGQVDDEAGESPFKHIKGEFSVYSAQGVYVYVWDALTKQLKMIRLGPSDLIVDERADSLDEFGRLGEGLIEYFLEAVRYDKVLAEHLELRQEGSMLVITMKV